MVYDQTSSLLYASFFEYLLEFITEDVEDECLLKLSEQLGRPELVELIGGPGHIITLFPLLEKLAGIEETVVRDAASKALRSVMVGFFMM